MEELSSLDNVPRKEKAFRNFASNSLRLRGNHGSNIVDTIWAHLCKVRQESQEEKKCDQNNNDHPSKECKTEQDSDEKSKEKIETPPQNKTESITNDTIPLIAATKSSGKSKKNKNKDLLKVIKKKLKKSPKHKMKIKALRKDLKINNAFILKKDDFKAIVKKLVDEKSEKFTLKGKYIALV